MIKGNYFRGKKYIESFVTELEKRGKKWLKRQLQN
jgi:hypothetical protein